MGPSDRFLISGEERKNVDWERRGAAPGKDRARRTPARSAPYRSALPASSPLPSFPLLPPPTHVCVNENHFSVEGSDLGVIHRTNVHQTPNHILEDRWDREQSQPFLTALSRAECEGFWRGVDQG